MDLSNICSSRLSTLKSCHSEFTRNLDRIDPSQMLRMTLKGFYKSLRCYKVLVADKY